MDELPSPALRGDGPARPGFDAALFGALRAQLTRLERENAELRFVISQLHARLYRANEARERWVLRKQAWHRERAELVARLADGDGRRNA